MLGRITPFKKLPEASLNEIRAVTVSRSMSAGEFVFQAEAESDVTLSSVYVVLSGRVRLVDNEQQATIRLLSSGEIFGHFSLIRRMPVPYRAEMVESGVVLEIPNDTIRGLFSRHPFFAGWFQADLRRFERELGAFDDVAGNRFLFGQRLSELNQSQTPSCDHHLSIQEAAQLMSKTGCDYAIVLREGLPIGIVSDIDLREKVVATGLSVDQPVSSIMTTNHQSSPARASVFDGLMAMEQHGWHHLILLDDEGGFSGVVSDTDLAKTLLASPSALQRRLTYADSNSSLRQLRHLADQSLVTMHRRGVRADDLLRMNTGFNDAMTVRIIDLVSHAMPSPPPDLQWCWLSLGSEGRGEMGLRTDQDNAIIYECPDVEAADAWLKALATTVNSMLNEAGIDFCEGGLMAREPAMRQNVSHWRSSLEEWLSDPVEERQLWISALLDCRSIYGDGALCGSFKQVLLELLQVQRGFPRTLALAAMEPALPVRKFPVRRLRGTRREAVEVFDVKQEGTRLITNAARLFCLQVGWLEQTDTSSRLSYLAENVPELKETAAEALVAYSVFTDLRLGWHVEQVMSDKRPSDTMPVAQLGETRKRLLLGAYQTVEEIRYRIQHQFRLGA